MHKLIIEDDEGRTTVVPLVRDELTIGRKEGNSIRLTERNVSRRHARLFKQNGEICVEDFASHTGVRVNGLKISGPTPLHDMDLVTIGDYKLSVRSDEAAAIRSQATAPDPSALSATSATLPISATTATPILIQAPGAPASEESRPASEMVTPPPPGLPSVAPATPLLHMDASPTMPLRTLEELGRASQMAPTTQSARLVVLTTELAGTEIRLDRPSLVVGRTDENDVILNHPSISRHHAKIVRDGGRYTVVDLQSANGVRVGGESYERVDVQAGDVLELGHVKLRFVGPQESWLFDPRDYLPRSRRKLKLGGAVAGIALAAILILVLQGKKPGQTTTPVITVAPTPSAPVPLAATLFAEATSAVATENWDKAVTALDLLLSRPVEDPNTAAVNSRALELKRRVDLERRGADIFASFQKAVEDKEPDVALSRYEQIPAESVYKARAEPALDAIKTLFVTAHLELAEAARAQGNCEEAGAEVEKIQQVDAENRQARDIMKKCKVRPAARATIAAAAPGPVSSGAALTLAERPAAASPARTNPVGAVAARAVSAPTAEHATGAPRTAAPRPVRVAAGARTVVTTKPGSESQASGAGASLVDSTPTPTDATDLIRQAREAWLHQQCGSAIELSRRALRLKATANDAHQIIAVCACSTRDKEGALKSYAKLDERSRAMVRTLCARNGVDLLE